MPICLCIICGCFHVTMAELSTCERKHMLCKAMSSDYVALIEKVCQPCTKGLEYTYSTIRGR